MPILIRDIETRSVLSLRTTGAWRYSLHASTSVLCLGYAVDDGPVKVWAPDDPIPLEFQEAASNPKWSLAAFNNFFEHAIESNVLAPRYGWPTVPLGRQRCLQAAVLARALPASLDGVAKALKLPVQKDLIGYRTMLLTAKPRRARADEDPALTYWHDDPERHAILRNYCARDVETERAVYHEIGFLPEPEQSIWLLSERINAAGVPIDAELLDAAIRISKDAKAQLGEEIVRVTDGLVTSPNQTARIQQWLSRNGVIVKDLQRETIRQALMRNDLPEPARHLLELRQSGAIASANKLHTMRGWLSDDGRIRGAFRFHGTSTGRFSSLGVQLQNLRKPKSKDLAATIDAVLTGDLAHLRAINPAPMSAIGDISRALIKAAKDRRFLIADLSGIESRTIAWLAGEQSKLDLWAAYDASGSDPDLDPYRKLGLRAFGLPEEHARDIGKTADLAFSYMGSVGAWRKMAPPGDTLTDAKVLHHRDTWRRAHPKIVSFWNEITRAAKLALRCPGVAVPCRRVSLYCGRNFLRLKLPSGRMLFYPFPRLKANWRYGDSVVTFMDASAGRWGECRHGHGAYGGLWTENVVQAVARDIFVAAMLRLEARGYQIVAHAHDEVICEVPEGIGSLEEFMQIFTAVPDWAEGLPIAAKGREADRFAKITPPDSATPEPEEPDAGDEDDDDDAGEAVLIEADDVELELVKAPAPETKMAPAPNGTPNVASAPIDDGPPRRSLRDILGPPDNEHWNGKILCPFHDDHTPSLHVYDTYVRCYSCDTRMDAVDYLMITQGICERAEAEKLLEPDEGHPAAPSATERARQDLQKNRRALELWNEARPLEGTLAEQYLCVTRRINLSALPDYGAASLRFHPHCPFGPGQRHPCLVALRRDALTDEPRSIHRIALSADAQKIERMMLGSGGVVKLWPATDHLVIGEGIETTLAAATRISHRGALLQPAWAMAASGVMRQLPPTIPNVQRLIILVDNDPAGRESAAYCATRWSGAGRRVLRLTPKVEGTDFNDLLVPEVAQ